jgi:hypothetical protein
LSATNRLSTTSVIVAAGTLVAAGFSIDYAMVPTAGKKVTTTP